MDYGAKVSKSGHDVLTAADTDLVFSSKFGTFTVFANGQGSLTLDGTNPQTITIAHNLGYRPAFAVYSEIHSSWGGASGDFYMMPFLHPIGGDIGIVPYCDSTNLYIRYGGQHTTGSYTLNYKYFIYLNKAL